MSKDESTQDVLVNEGQVQVEPRLEDEKKYLADMGALLNSQLQDAKKEIAQLSKRLGDVQAQYQLIVHQIKMVNSLSEVVDHPAQYATEHECAN